MNKPIILNEMQIQNIKKLAKELRQTLGFVGEAPIANDIFTILDNMNIRLLGYPIESSGEKPAFSAALMFSKDGNEELVFIGLNTAIFFDKQIFAIAHEIYHYITKTATHLSRLDDDEYNMLEFQANRFAAEFLLPESTLESIILDEFKISNLNHIQDKTLLRFIARLQCTWWLPYHSLLKRLREINAISDEQYKRLYSIDERNMDGEYSRIGKAINKEIFTKLNTATNSIEASPKDIEIIIRNFEDNIIDEDQFNNILNTFDKSPDEFGYEIEVSTEDIDEFEEFFNKKAQDEH
jgi:Zn-dependent peptidase ImmA (M78 family)